MTDRIAHVIPRSLMLPAVGQGALGIETRADDDLTRSLVAALDYAATHQAVLAERALLLTLRGGCLAPVGAWARLEQGHLALEAVVLSGDGMRKLKSQGTAPASDAVQLGRRVAELLLDQGAAELIASSRSGERDVSAP
jgi:hydroxymethylbilane synthase